MSEFGLGVDIEEVRRFEKLIHNKRFLARVYTREEIAYCRAKKNQAQHFAVRFAAKEAVWKAINSSLSKRKKNIGHKDIGIKNSPSGRPHVILPVALNALAKKVHVSLSHTNAYVVAMAVLKA